MTPEGKVTEQIRRFLKRMEADGGLWWVKLAGGPRQRSGLPDFMIVYKGRAIFLEVKAPGGVPTNLQLATLKKLRSARAIAECVNSVDQVISLLRTVYETPFPS